MEHPDEWESDVLLADGGTMHVRPIRPSDRERLVAFHDRQSPESIYFRYFSPRPTLSDADLSRFTNVDYHDRMAFVGLVGSELVGIARYDRYPATAIAEVAFFTDDAHRQRGMATVLLEYLAAAARDAGLQGFVAQVLPENRRMLSVFASAGFEVSTQFADGVIEVVLGIEATDAARAIIDERAKLASARSMQRFLAPSSIAVIGVSRDADAVGSRVVQNLVEGGFAGRLFAVGHHAQRCAGLAVHRSIADIDVEVDVAIVCVPAVKVREVLAQCGRRHVHAAVVIAAGFADGGELGRRRELELVAMTRRMGMRLLGPNSMGIINTDPSVAMLGTFVDVHPAAGRLGVSSESGTLGAAIVQHAARRGLGVSSFVDLGNRSDISNNDLLQFWEDDPATDQVLLYLEHFGNAANFARIARSLARVKPVIAVKSGGIKELGGPDLGIAIDANIDVLLSQTGIIRVDTLHEMLDVAMVLVSQPVPDGQRIAVVTNSAGPAHLALDAIRGTDLVLVGPTGGDTGDVFDAGFSANPEQYADLLGQVCARSDVDMVLVLCTPPMPGAIGGFASAIADVVDGSGVPVVATYLGLRTQSQLVLDGSPPLFDFPEAAVRALAKVSAHGAWRRRQGVGHARDLETLRAATSPWMEVALEQASTRMTREDVVSFLRAADIEIVEQFEAHSEEEAHLAAAKIGWPVALKAGGLVRPAKTEAGGVGVDIHDADELSKTFARMSAMLGPDLMPTVVQAMAPRGVDVRVRVVRSDLVGPVLSLEVDRTYLDTSATAGLQVLPCSAAEAERLVAHSGLDAALGSAFTSNQVAVGVDHQSASVELIGLLETLSSLFDVWGELAALDLDPVLVSPQGAFVIDAKVFVEHDTADERDSLRRIALDDADS